MEQKIYSENRLLAIKSHRQFDHLGPQIDMPLYNQPYDAPICRQILKDHLTFRSVLIERIRQQNAKCDSHEKRLREAYNKSYQEWLKKLDEKKSSEEKQGRDKEMCRHFKGVFRELRKRNDFGNYVAKKIRMRKIQKCIKGAAILPFMFDEVRKPPPRFDNRNGLLKDPLKIQKQLINTWTKEEKEIFTEKFLKRPKKFHFIASFLEHKSAADCVAFYYQSKKKEKYKTKLMLSKFPKNRKYKRQMKATMSMLSNN